MAKFEINISATGQATISSVDNSLKSLDNTAIKTQTSLNSTAKSTDMLSTSLKSLGSVIAVVGLAELAKTAIKTADTMNLLEGRVSLVTKSVSEQIAVQKQLFDISQRTRQGLEATTGLYTNLATSMQQMGKSQADVLKTTETINKAIIISGSSTSSAAAAITQLGQAFASGTLRGDELNSILENSKGLAMAIADGMGVPIGKLRTLGSEGKITSEILATALEKSADDVNAKFAKMPETVGQALTKVQNSAMAMIGRLDDEFASSTALVGVVNGFETALISAESTVKELGGVMSDFGNGAIEVFGNINKSISETFSFLVSLTGEASSKATENFTFFDYFALGLKTASAGIGMLYDGLIKVINFATMAWAKIRGDEEGVKKAWAADAILTKEMEARLDGLAKSYTNIANAKKAALTTKIPDSDLTVKGKKTTSSELSKEELKAEQDRLKKAHDIAQSQLKMLQEESDKKIKLEEDYQSTIVSLEQKANENRLDGLLKEALQTYNHYNNLIAKYADVAGAESTLRAMQSSAMDEIIAKQKELNDAYDNKAAIDSLDEIYGRYEKLIDAQIELAENGMNIDFDFGDGAKELNNISKAMQQMHVGSLKFTKQDMKLQEDYAKAYLEAGDDTLKQTQLKADFDADTAKLKEANTNAEIAGYANLAGAMSQYAKEGSSAAKALSIAQSALSLVNLVQGISTQSKLPFPMNIAAMAATASAGAGYLSQIGQTLSSNSESVSYDASSSMEANIGTGSVLGDTTAQSKSIENSLELLSDYAKPEFSLLAQMNKSLLSIDQKMGGLTGLLVREGGYAFGEGYEGFDTGFSNNLSYSDSILYKFSPMGLTDSLLGMLGMGDNFIGGIFDSVLGGLFGKTSVSQTMTDSGIYFADALLEDAINSFNGSAYQTISTTVKKKSWFSSSSSTSVNTYFEALDDELERQFELVLSGLYDTTLLAGDALDTSFSDIENGLSNFVVSIGKISLKDKTGEEIQEELNAVFGEIADDIAREAFPALDRFQQVGEGLFDTMVRVSAGMEEAEYYISRLGKGFEDLSYTELLNPSGDVGVEALAQSIRASDAETQKFSDSLVELAVSVSETSEDLFELYNMFNSIGVAMEFLAGSGLFLSESMIYGAGSTEALSGGINDYIENFYTSAEQAAYQLGSLNLEFEKLNLSTPKTNEEFKALLESFDLTTDEGQELYGRVVILSDAFSETTSAIDALNESLDNTYMLALGIITNAEDVIGSSILSSLDMLIAGKETIENYVKELRNPSATTSSTRADFVSAYKEMMVSIRRNEDDTQEAIANAISASNQYLDVFAKTATSQKDIDFQRLVMANRFENVTPTVDKEITDLYEQAEDLLGVDSDIVKYLKLIDGSTSKLTYQQYLDNNELASALNVVNSSINSLVLGGVQLSILQDDKGTINALVAEDFQLSVGDDWEEVVSAFNSGFNWNIDELLGAVSDVSTGSKLEFDWNKDGIVDTVATVLPDGKTKLEFDWNNDAVVDLSAIIGSNGQLEELIANTSETNGLTTSDYLNFLYQIEKDKIAQESAPLSASSFTAGHILGTAEKIDFAKATGLTMGSEEFDKAIQDIQGFSTTTADVAYLKELAGMSGTTVANPEIMSTLKSLNNAGYLPTDASRAYTNIVTALDRNAQSEYDRKMLRGTAADEALATLYANFYRDTGVTTRFNPSLLEDSDFLGDLQVAGNFQNQITSVNDAHYGYSGWIADSTIAKIREISALNDNLEKQTYFGFATGTPSVPYDMRADIHQGEIIVPKTFSDGLRSGDLVLGGESTNKDNAILQKEVSEMKQIMMSLLQEVAVNNAGVRQMSNGYNAMIVEVV